MEILDKKNKLIIYHLDINSRQPYSEIAKKVSLSKNSVRLRIKELERKQIINGYYTYVDNYRLGYQAIRVHYTFQNTNPELEKAIIDFLSQNKHTILIARAYGIYDLSAIFAVKNIHDFYRLWQEINDRFGVYFKNRKISHYLKEYHFHLSYLFSNDKQTLNEREYEICGGGEPIEIDELDYQILQLLSTDARISLIDLSSKLCNSTQTLSYRIKRLSTLGVIKRFGVLLNLSKIGYKSYKAYIQLNDFSKKSDIIKYVMKNNNISYIDFTIGEYDIELDFHFKDVAEFYNILSDITKTFPNAIRSYSSVTIPYLHKERLLPESI